MAKQYDEEVSAEDAADDGSPRVYEIGFHLEPELPTEEIKKAYGEVRDIVAQDGAIIAEAEPVQIQLAYTISRPETTGRRDFSSAHFAWIAYEANAESHSRIISAAAADKRIIRFIDLVTTKEAARHAEELRDMALKMPEKTEDIETAAGAELDAAIEGVTV